MDQLYRKLDWNKKALTEQIFKVFCDNVGYGDPDDFANILYGRYTVEDFAYSDDWKYWTVHGYFLDKVVPHKTEVFKAGAELAEQPWFFDFIGESADLWFDNLWLHDISKFSAVEALGYAFHDFKSQKTDPLFDSAWNHHVKHNEHHHEYWINGEERLVMPKIYIAEMVADWIGAGKVYGGELDDWMDKNLHNFSLNQKTAENLQLLLYSIGYNTSFSDGILRYKKTQSNTGTVI